MATKLCREADLSLRGPGRFLRPKVSWPAGDGDDHPIAVLLTDASLDREVAEVLCAQGGFVVLALRATTIDVGTIALEWAADHALELGADPERLVVVGGRLAAAVALEARHNGWPEISRLALTDPGTGEYANRVREAGIDVVDLYVQGPISFDRIRGLRD